jgi:outer membrane biosynthesis protein TonB
MSLDIAAMEAVRKWVYSPAPVNGEPSSVTTVVEVRFGK